MLLPPRGNGVKLEDSAEVQGFNKLLTVLLTQ